MLDVRFRKTSSFGVHFVVFRPAIQRIASPMLLIGTLLIMLFGFGPVWGYLCGTPVDIHDDIEALWMPPFLLGIKRNDYVAFGVHTSLGSVLEKQQCDSRATALQWLKAGSHAVMPGSRALATAGLRTTWMRSDRTILRPYICAQVEPTPEQMVKKILIDVPIACSN